MYLLERNVAYTYVPDYDASTYIPDYASAKKIYKVFFCCFITDYGMQNRERTRSTEEWLPTVDILPSSIGGKRRDIDVQIGWDKNG